MPRYLAVAVVLYQLSSLGASYFPLSGTVVSFDETHVILSTTGGMLRLPRKAIKTRGLRPGSQIATLIFGDTKVESIDTAPTKRELNTAAK